VATRMGRDSLIAAIGHGSGSSSLINFSCSRRPSCAALKTPENFPGVSLGVVTQHPFLKRLFITDLAWSLFTVPVVADRRQAVRSTRSGFWRNQDPSGMNTGVPRC